MSKKPNKQSKNAPEGTYHSRVVTELKSQGKTQQWLATNLGKHRQYMRQILKTNKTPKYAEEIAEMLEVSPVWLATGVGDKYLYKKVKSNLVKLYSLLKLKEKKSLTALKPIEMLYMIEEEFDFALRMDDAKLASATLPDNALLFFQSSVGPKITLQDTVNNIALVYHRTDNQIALSQIDTDNAKAPICRALNTKDSFPLAEANVLGLLKEIRIRSY